MRRLVALAAVLALGLAGGAVVAYADAPANACDSVYVDNSNASLKRYIDCRDDRIERQLTQIQAGTVPSASPTPSSTPKPSPTPTSASPTPSPSNPPAGTCTNPSVTFTGEGSQGVGNGYDISAEQWGVSGYNYKSTLRFCNPNSWNVDVTTDNAKGDGAVKAYPSIRKIYHDWGQGGNFSGDPRLSSFPKLTIDFAATDPATCPGCIYDTAFDLWLNGIANSTSTELMVWTHNVGQTPYGSKVASGIQIGGHTWDLWSGNSNHYIAYVPTDTANISSGTLDVKAFVADLSGRGRIGADPQVGQLSYGVEPVSTGGVSRHWDFTRFTVNQG